MRTRRNRKNRKNRGGGIFSDISKAIGLSKDTANPQNGEAQGQSMEAQGQPMPEAQGQPIQEAVPIDPNDPKVDADIKADADAKVDVQATALRGAGENIDTEVAKLTEEEGYYFRAFINAIGICNSTMKMKHNLLNPLDAEAFVCGEQCHKRADIIRKTIERLIPYLQRSDALGYISSQRVMANSATYLKNSAASLASKGYKGLMNAPSAIANAPSAIGNALSPTSLSNIATKVGSNITTSINALTRKAPAPGQPAQIQGGRRRTRRRR